MRSYCVITDDNTTVKKFRPSAKIVLLSAKDSVRTILDFISNSFYRQRIPSMTSFARWLDRELNKGEALIVNDVNDEKLSLSISLSINFYDALY